MATFKMGQRVRIIYQGPISRATIGVSAFGHTATITSIPAEASTGDCGVLVDDYPLDKNWGSYAAMFWQLSPLMGPEELETSRELEAVL